MAVDHIRYDILTQEALRSVVRTVLADAAKNGLPGDHHFYIEFDTRADGVRLSPRMKAQYPETMTIVLQHQFWDLTVTESGFEVGLAFGGVPERLAVPFAAINGFLDPSVEFGLRFADASELGSTEATAPDGTETSRRPPAEHKRSPALATPAPIAANPEPSNEIAEERAASPSSDDGGSAGKEPQKPTSGEVVRLDRFRKK
ncbi:MAG: hypothetical protein IT537_05370 [Hyphomicrobiales bacterium]|nr:hypothetical protein [Hyphomicrobiales bacterium]